MRARAFRAEGGGHEQVGHIHLLGLEEAAMDHEPHLFDRLGDAGAVGVAAVAGIEEEHVEVALPHGVEQAAEVDAGILGRAAHGVDEFLFAFGLAALHREEPPA